MLYQHYLTNLANLYPNLIALYISSLNIISLHVPNVAILLKHQSFNTINPSNYTHNGLLNIVDIKKIETIIDDQNRFILIKYKDIINKNKTLINNHNR